MKTKTAPLGYQVEIQICTGSAQPFPIPGFPKLPTYAFGIVGPLETKRRADARMRKLCSLNPGYSFCVAAVQSKGGQ